MLDSLFLFSAIIGGAATVLRTVLMLLGVGDDHSFGGAHDLGAAQASEPHSDLDTGTRLISLQGIAAFLMIFGLVGLAGTREAQLAPPLAVSIAVAAGFAAMWTVARVFSAMTGLQSSGTLDLSQAIGKEGVVYLTVKPGSGGQVQVDVQGRLGIYEAHTRGTNALATGQSIRVVGVRANALVVEEIAAS